MCTGHQCQAVVVVYHQYILWQWKEDLLKASEISCPKVYPAPLGLIPQPHRSSGSLHSKSHMGPSCGTSWILSIERIWSSVSIEGDRPPCKQKIYHHQLNPEPLQRIRGTYLRINQSGQWQIIKQVCKEFPDVGIPIFPQTLVVESIDLGNLSRLVIST